MKIHWSKKQQKRLATLMDQGVWIGYWCTDIQGRPDNLPNTKPFKDGLIQKWPYGIGLPATKEPNRVFGSRVWIVALHGSVTDIGGYCGTALSSKREVLGEIFPEEAIFDSKVAIKLMANQRPYRPRFWLDLAGHKLSRSYLEGQNLYNSNLAGVDLSGSHLSHSNMSCCYLSNANLAYTQLDQTNLSKSDLTGADLSWSNLANADLRWACISGTNFSNAFVKNAILPKSFKKIWKIDSGYCTKKKSLLP